MLTVQNLSVTINGKEIVHSINFGVAQGEWLMLVGPNGAGKSTIISALAQDVPYSGRVFFEGQDLSKIKSRERAAKIAVLRQTSDLSYSFLVKETVEMGRYAHETFFTENNRQSADVAEKYMQLTNVAEFANKSILSLSGGELQRVFLARTLAQEPRLLLLDEPTTHLDIFYQKQIFDILRGWLNKTRAIISVVHDINFARFYGTKALLLQDGQLQAFGSDALSRENVRKVFRVDYDEIFKA